jgi:hypothetical protein
MRPDFTINIEGEGCVRISGYECGLPPMEIKSKYCKLDGMYGKNNTLYITRVRPYAMEERHHTEKPKYEVGDLLDWSGGKFLVLGYKQEDSDLVWRDEYELYSPVTGSVIEFSIRFLESEAELVA